MYYLSRKKIPLHVLIMMKKALPVGFTEKNKIVWQKNKIMNNICLEHTTPTKTKPNTDFEQSDYGRIIVGPLQFSLIR